MNGKVCDCGGRVKTTLLAPYVWKAECLNKKCDVLSTYGRIEGDALEQLGKKRGRTWRDTEIEKGEK